MSCLLFISKKMETKTIWNDFNEELYFFILKKVKNKTVANDIFQNTFLKIHKNRSSLQSDGKVKAWIFQIARHEIALENFQQICFFDRFINKLPQIYKETINEVYIKGEKQKDAAKVLGISLENLKARIRRAKCILKVNFNECCKYEIDRNGKLVGESNCSTCQDDFN
jgi:RNA polymerase sigma-70 factor (ECF subfamily)